MSTSQEHENMNISMLSEVSGMDNSLSLAEIDRIIGNLIGKDAESRAVADNGEQSPVLRSPVIKHSPHLVNPSASSSSSTLHRFVSPNVRRIVSPAQSTPSPFGTDRPEQSLDSPTDVPLFSDGSHVNGPTSPQRTAPRASSPVMTRRADVATANGPTSPQRTAPSPVLTRRASSPGTQARGGVMRRSMSPAVRSPVLRAHQTTQLNAPRMSATPSGALPLQKITLFRKLNDGDGLKNRSAGVGIACETDSVTGDVIIQKVFTGAPASNSGQVFSGDTLLQINGAPVSGLPTAQVLQLLSGEAGTPVSILVSHNPKYAKAMARGTQASQSLSEQETEERRQARERVLAARRRKSGVMTPSRDSQPELRSEPLERRQSYATTRTVPTPLDGGSPQPTPRRNDVRGDRGASKEVVDDGSFPNRLPIDSRHRSGDALGRSLDIDFKSDGNPSRRVGRSSELEGPYPSSPAAYVYPPLPTVMASSQNKTVMSEGSSDQADNIDKQEMHQVPSPRKHASSAVSSERDLQDMATLAKDTESKSIEELKMSFTMRMNEAIRMQRERMRVLLSDVDNKIVSIKKEHGLPEPSNDLRGASSGSRDAPSIFEHENKENDSRFALTRMPVEKIASPRLGAQPAPTWSSALESAMKDFLPDRDRQTEKLMLEMNQLREALAAVTGSIATSREASGSISGEALLPDAEDGWAEENEGLGAGEETVPIETDSWLKRKTSPLVQTAAAPDALDQPETDLLALAEKSKQKYMDIVRRLQNETFQSGIGYEMENSVHDEDDTIDSKSTEAESEQPEGEEGEEEEFLTISYNPRLKPTRGCMIKYRKGWPHRPLSPSEDEAAAHRLAHRGMKRSVLGAGIAASKEVLTPGLKTPYSPRHVMTPRGPMVVGPEGPVAPSQHPFVQEQMTILKCIRQYPELGSMPPEVVKAATVRFELGLEPDLVDDDDSDDDTGFEDRPQKNVVWAQGVATKDGNSAQRLHEASLAKRKAALAAAQEAAKQHASMLDEMQREHDRIRQMQVQQMGGPHQMHTPHHGQHSNASFYGQHSHSTPQHVQNSTPHQHQQQHQHHQHQMYASPAHMPPRQSAGGSSAPFAYPPGFSPAKSPAQHPAASATPSKMVGGAQDQHKQGIPSAMTPQEQHPPTPSQNGYFSKPAQRGGRPSFGGEAGGWGAKQMTPQQQQQQYPQKQPYAAPTQMSGPQLRMSIQDFA